MNSNFLLITINYHIKIEFTELGLWYNLEPLLCKVVILNVQYYHLLLQLSIIYAHF